MPRRPRSGNKTAISVQRTVPCVMLLDVSLRGAKRRGNLAVLGRITGRSRRKRNCLPEIATAPSGPRNDKSEGIAPLNLCRDHCQPARRSLTAATDAIGFYHFIDSLYESQALCRERHAAPVREAAKVLRIRCNAQFPPPGHPDVSFRGAKRRGNLAVHGWIIGKPRRKRNCLPEIATSAVGLLAMTIRNPCIFDDAAL